MPRKRTPLEPHLSVEELRTRALRATSGDEGRCWQALWLTARGYGPVEVVRLLDVSRDTLHRWKTAFNAQGRNFRPPVAARPLAGHRERGGA